MCSVHPRESVSQSVSFTDACDFFFRGFILKIYFFPSIWKKVCRSHSVIVSQQREKKISRFSFRFHFYAAQLKKAFREQLQSMIDTILLWNRKVYKRLPNRIRLRHTRVFRLVRVRFHIQFIAKIQAFFLNKFFNSLFDLK